MFSYLRSSQLEYKNIFYCKKCTFYLPDISCPKRVLIERVESIKYYGIVMDENINWKEYCKEM